MRNDGWKTKRVDLAEVPFHPQLVHFPIAFLLLSFIFDLVGAVRNSDKWNQFGGIILLLAIISAFAALQSGESSKETLNPMTENLQEAVEEHEESASTTFFFILVLGIFRGWLQLKGVFSSWLRWGYIILIGTGVFLILRVGHLGGKLVYQHGAGVNKNVLVPDSLK